MRVVFSLLLAFMIPGAHAANAVFTFLKTVPAHELNLVLTEERAAFMKHTGAQPPYAMPRPSKATQDVDIYTVEYDSSVPEQGHRTVRVTGLLALPKGRSSGSLPLMSYQHGTVFGKYEVPSFAFRRENPSGLPHYDAAYETRYMVALFAGNGFAVMAADYVGMGGHAQEPEAYFVKEATQQVNHDLYLNVQTFLRQKDIATSRLFLGGWSLGGLNTTGFLQKLESAGVKVDAAFTASAPSDPFAALNGLMYFPRQGIDAVWLNTIVALTVFSYEHYYARPGLARSVIHPDHYAALESIYHRRYGSEADLLAMFQRFGPLPLIGYFRPEYRDPAHFANSAYGELLRRNETYRQLFRTPLKMFYGSRDEVLKEPIATLASTYQNILIGQPDAAGNRVETRRVPGADHRATFITAAPEALDWMRGMK